MLRYLYATFVKRERDLVLLSNSLSLGSTLDGFKLEAAKEQHTPSRPIQSRLPWGSIDPKQQNIRTSSVNDQSSVIVLVFLVQFFRFYPRRINLHASQQMKDMNVWMNSYEQSIVSSVQHDIRYENRFSTSITISLYKPRQFTMSCNFRTKKLNCMLCCCHVGLTCICLRLVYLRKLI